MHHLAPPVPELDTARQPARLSHRQQLLHALGMGVEEHERHVARVVRDEHAVGGLGPAGRGGAVGLDPHLQRHGGVGRRVGDARADGPVDRRMRQVKEHVEHARGSAGLSEQAVEKGRELRADPGQGRHACEEGVQQAGSQGDPGAWGKNSGSGVGSGASVAMLAEPGGRLDPPGRARRKLWLGCNKPGDLPSTFPAVLICRDPATNRHHRRTISNFLR